MALAEYTLRTRTDAERRSSGRTLNGQPVTLYVVTQDGEDVSGPVTAEYAHKLFGVDVPTCQGCYQPLDERHRSGCPYWHPWPNDRVDHVQTKIRPV